jgi:hypothetical protein
MFGNSTYNQIGNSSTNSPKEFNLLDKKYAVKKIICGFDNTFVITSNL